MAIDKRLDEVIYQLLQFRRSRPAETHEFSGLPHNAAVLPLLQAKLEQIVSAFSKYRKIVYDIQGIRDSGTDLLFKQTNDEDDFLCFQVKTEDDLRDNDHLKTLKAQYFDSRQRYPAMSDYYLLLCCDLSESVTAGRKRRAMANQDLVRNVAAELSTEKGLHVIEPAYAHAFLRLTTTQIDAVVKSRVGQEDIVVKTAVELVAELTPTELALVVSIVHRTALDGESQLSVDDLTSNEFIRECYELVPDLDRSYFVSDLWEEKPETDKEESAEAWAEFIEGAEAGNIRFNPLRYMDLVDRLQLDLAYLEDNFLYCTVNGHYRLYREETAPIAALLTDGHVRYGYEGEELDWYTWSVLSPHYAARAGIRDDQDWVQ